MWEMNLWAQELMLKPCHLLQQASFFLERERGSVRVSGGAEERERISKKTLR